MMRFTFPLFFATAAFGQITLATSTVTFSMRAQGEDPYVQNIAITGTGSALSVSCTAGSPDVCNGLNRVLDATTAPTTLHLFFDGYTNSGFPAGLRTGTLTISASSGCTGSCNIAASLVVHPATYPTWKAASGAITGCSNVDSNYVGDQEICNPTPAARPGGSFTPPITPCSTFTDGNFGSTITRLTTGGVRVVTADSVQKAWNGNNTLVATSNVFGTNYFTNIATCADDWSGFSYSDGAADPGDTLGTTYYTMDTYSITKRVLTTPPNGTTNTTIYTSSDTAGLLYNGGDGDINKDGYWCTITQHGTKFALVNVRTGWNIEKLFTDHNWDATFNYPRACTVAKGFSPVNGKLYFILTANVSQGSNEIYSWKVGDTAITDEGSQPMSSMAAQYGWYSGATPPIGAACGSYGSCRGHKHMDTVEANGHEWLLYPGGPSHTRTETSSPFSSYYVDLLMMCLDCGPIANMELDVESGGSAYYIGPLNMDDNHISCSRKSPVCVVETDSDPGVNAVAISNAVTSGSTIVLTANGKPPIVTGDNTLINLVGGCTNANGQFAGANVTVSGTTITLAGVTCNGAYSNPANTSPGAIAKDVAVDQRPHQGELILFDATNIIANKTVVATRLAKHRSVAYNNDPILGGSGYYGQSHPSVNDAGTKVVYESSYGFPGQSDVYMVNTGYTAMTSVCDINGDGVLNNGDITALISIVLGGGACTIGDLNRDGHCDIVDVQILENSVLVGTCLAN